MRGKRHYNVTMNKGIHFKTFVTRSAVGPHYNVPGFSGFFVATFGSINPVRSPIETAILVSSLLCLQNLDFLHATLCLVCSQEVWNEIIGVITILASTGAICPTTLALYLEVFLFRLSTATPATVAFPLMCILKIATIVHAFAGGNTLSTKELNRWRGLPWCCGMAAAKLCQHRSGGWEHTVMPLFSTLLVSCNMLSLFKASPTAISNWLSFLHLPGTAGSVHSDNSVKV